MYEKNLIFVFFVFFFVFLPFFHFSSFSTFPPRQIGQQNPATTTPAGNDPDGEYDPHYEALVTLKEVKVETGEENEECLFSERSKLYRFVEGEWKERGVGDLRILANKADNSKQRIVMRREVVKKLCANHFLRQGMTTSTREG